MTVARPGPVINVLDGAHMGYRSSPAPRRAKNDLILGVGSHAYVNWSPPVGEPRRPVPMIDASGTPVANDLADGQEVEIVSWRPRSRDGLSYQIRRLSDGSEWWITATFLRTLPDRPYSQSP